MKRISLLIFLIAGSLELASWLFEIRIIHLVCKPMLMPGLLLYYLVSQREQKQYLSTALITALAFCWAGDVILMFEGELYFMLGLAAFLVAHVFYIFTFRQFSFDDHTDSIQGIQRLRFAFPVILYGTGLVVILFPHLDDLVIPVLIYALVLTIMVIQALLRYARTETSSFIFVFIGALLFMISDSLLAVNKFMEPISGSGFWIMSTYVIAQFLIVKGLLRHQT